MKMGIFDEESFGTGRGKLEKDVDGGKKEAYGKRGQDERRRSGVGDRSFEIESNGGNPMSEDCGRRIQRSFGLVGHSAWKRRAIVMIRQDIIISFICLSCFGFIFLFSGFISLLLVVIFRVVSHSYDSHDKSQG
jgi:hypothetical protein